MNLKNIKKKKRLQSVYNSDNWAAFNSHLFYPKKKYSKPSDLLYIGIVWPIIQRGPRLDYANN